MNKYKVLSLETHSKYAPLPCVTQLFVNDFVLAFPNPVQIVTEDKVFTQIIDSDWTNGCKLYAQLSVNIFNDIMKRALNNNAESGVFFKSQLFGYDKSNLNQKLNIKQSIDKLNQLIKEFPILDMVFEDYTINSGYLQFKLGLNKEKFRQL